MSSSPGSPHRRPAGDRSGPRADGGRTGRHRAAAQPRRRERAARGYAPRHGAARGSRAAPVLKPTFAVVACASLGVTGLAVGAHQLRTPGVDPAVVTLSDVGPALRAVATPSQLPEPDGPQPAAAADGASSDGSGVGEASGGNAGLTSRTWSGGMEASVALAAATMPTQPPAGEAGPGVASGGGVLDRQEVERKRAEIRAARARERAAAAQAAAAEAARQAAASGDPQAIAQSLIGEHGWDSVQFSCLVSLWDSESGWDVHATNPSSGAYGIPQALPGTKMAAYGSDWQDNPETQIRWGLDYIGSRYGTPCGAWSYWQANGWY